jgi:hypothetical protein
MGRGTGTGDSEREFNSIGKGNDSFLESIVQVFLEIEFG